MRLSKIALVATIALWLALVAFGNLTDYGSNLAFVQHVLAMDSIFPDAAIRTGKKVTRCYLPGRLILCFRCKHIDSATPQTADRPVPE